MRRQEELVDRLRWDRQNGKRQSCDRKRWKIGKAWTQAELGQAELGLAELGASRAETSRVENGL